MDAEHVSEVGEEAVVHEVGRGQAPEDVGLSHLRDQALDAEQHGVRESRQSRGSRAIWAERSMPATHAIVACPRAHVQVFPAW